jgi:hypothetical protein
MFVCGIMRNGGKEKMTHTSPSCYENELDFRTERVMLSKAT